MVKVRLSAIALRASLLAATLALTGCIAATCEDGTPIVNANGGQIRVNNKQEEYELRQSMCKPTTPSATVPPVPTNFVPVLGGAAIAVAGAALGGGGGGSSSSTNGTN